MFDDRLEFVDLPSKKFLKKQGLSFFLEEDNEDYFTDEAVVLFKAEVEAFKAASEQLYKQLIAAAKEVAQQGAWERVGIPENAVELVQYSLANESHLHLLGRFDFAGGMDNMPLKLIEFNADTCSLMPETAYVQAEQSAKKRKFRQFNQLIPQMTASFKNLLNRYPEKYPNLLLMHMGHEEDQINTEVVAAAARKAGFSEVHIMRLEHVIFSEDEGVFVEISANNYNKYDFVYKMIPWEFIAYEEPELMRLLTQIVKKDLAIVLNPAFSMLLQSKGILKYLSDLYPNDSNILKASFTASDFPDLRYARKPMFGRVGENVQIFTGSSSPASTTDGDFGHFPSVYQELAEFNADEDGDIYQPSMYWSNAPCALCIRRRDDLIVDDDAEFMSHLVE